MVKKVLAKRGWMLLATGLFVFSLWSCNGEADRLKKQVQELKTQNQQLQSAQTTKDSSINNFLSGYAEIQHNLDSIKQKQQLVSANISTNGDMKSGNSKDQIITDIKAINNLMEQNHKIINRLKSKMRHSNTKIAGLQKLMKELTAKLQAKDAQIADLQGQVVSLNKDLKYLFTQYNARIDELNSKDSTLNVAFYAFGTKKELKNKGVIVDKGGIIGIGSVEELKSDFNKGYFTQVDVSKTTAIPLMVKSAKLITSHPQGSYKFVGKDDKVDSLVITNQQKFWSASKYCVIVVKN